LALTEGLPQSFSTFIVALDSLPQNEHSLDNVITRLLNEEVQQLPTNTCPDLATTPKIELAITLTAMTKGKCPTSKLTSY